MKLFYDWSIFYLGESLLSHNTWEWIKFFHATSMKFDQWIQERYARKPVTKNVRNKSWFLLVFFQWWLVCQVWSFQEISKYQYDIYVYTNNKKSILIGFIFLSGPNSVYGGFRDEESRSANLVHIESAITYSETISVNAIYPSYFWYFSVIYPPK